MSDRKIFLVRLREMFGDCSRQAFLQRLRNLDMKSDVYIEDVGYIETCRDIDDDIDTGIDIGNNDYDSDIHDSNDGDYGEPTQVKMIDINGTDAWFNHVQTLKNISGLYACLERYQILLGKSAMIVYRNSVQKSLAAMKVYVDKYFKEPQDITDETSEDVARQTGKFVKENVSDLLRACHRGKIAGRSEELKFYNDFETALEKYLESICVYRKDVNLGADIRSNAKWFETPLPKETSTPEKIGTIDEIELAPHMIYFRNDNGVREDVIVRGICIIFAEARQR